jgi:RNA polymerase sigma-70 factor (ECF subfamily)
VPEKVGASMTPECLGEALSALPEPERTPIGLAYLDGRTYRQAANDLDLPEATIKSRIRSGLQRLSVRVPAEPDLVP